MAGTLNKEVRRFMVLEHRDALLSKCGQQIEFEQPRVEVGSLEIGYKIIVGIRHCEINLTNSNCCGNVIRSLHEQLEILARHPVTYIQEWRPLLDSGRN